MLVNGEHRIGIYACAYNLANFISFQIHPKKNIYLYILTATKILDGEELFINYGPSFFPTSPNTQEKEKEKEEGPKPTLSPSIHSEHSSDSSYFEESDL